MTSRHIMLRHVTSSRCLLSVGNAFSTAWFIFHFTSFPFLESFLSSFYFLFILSTSSLSISSFCFSSLHLFFLFFLIFLSFLNLFCRISFFLSFFLRFFLYVCIFFCEEGDQRANIWSSLPWNWTILVSDMKLPIFGQSSGSGLWAYSYGITHHYYFPSIHIYKSISVDNAELNPTYSSTYPARIES